MNTSTYVVVPMLSAEQQSPRRTERNTDNVRLIKFRLSMFTDADSDPVSDSGSTPP